ncbi:unnamed protein product, partial [Penicillium egyptiacum]
GPSVPMADLRTGPWAPSDASSMKTPMACLAHLRASPHAETPQWPAWAL